MSDVNRLLEHSYRVGHYERRRLLEVFNHLQWRSEEKLQFCEIFLGSRKKRRFLRVFVGHCRRGARDAEEFVEKIAKKKGIPGKRLPISDQPAGLAETLLEALLWPLRSLLFNLKRLKGAIM